MYKNAYLIVFTGIDGSGKSTQAKLLVDAFIKKRISAKYVWGRWEPFLLKPATIFARKISSRKARSISGRNYHVEIGYKSLSDTKQRIFSIPGVKLAWFYLAILEYYIQVLKKIVQPIKMGQVVVCDRYIYDALADMAINFGYHGRDILKITRRPIMCLFPKPNMSIFINIAPETGYIRKSDGTSLRYLIERENIYSTIADIYGMVRVDGSLAIHETHSQIQKRLNLV